MPIGLREISQTDDPHEGIGYASRSLNEISHHLAILGETLKRDGDERGTSVLMFASHLEFVGNSLHFLVEGSRPRTGAKKEQPPDQIEEE